MNYRINTYPYGFMIERKVVAQKTTDNQQEGDERWQAYKYPKGFQGALETLLELCTRDHADEAVLADISELHTALNAAQADVRRIAREYEQRLAA